MMRVTVTSFTVFILVCLMVVQPVVAQTCQPGVTFVADVTVPDDTVYPPDAPFEKIWRLRNSGTCDWNDNYGPVFIDGDQLNADSPQQLGRTIAVGDATDVGIVMRAPTAPGTYISRWQMQDDTGTRFGTPFYVRIRVMQIQEPQAEITSPEPGAIVARQVAVAGSAIHPAFDYYKLEVGPGENPPDDQMGLVTVLIRDQVLDGQLGSWDTTEFDDGVYSLRLRVVDQNGNYQEAWVRNLTVNNAAPPPPTKQAVAPTAMVTLTLQPTETATSQPTETATPRPTETATTAPEDLGFTGASVKKTPVPTLAQLVTTIPLPTETAVPLPTETAVPLPTETAVPLPTETAVPLPTETAVPLPTETVKSVELLAIPPAGVFYQNADWGISFLYPEGWIIEDESFGSSYLSVKGGSSEEAMSVFSGGDFPSEISAPAFGVTGGPVSDLPDMPTPDVNGQIPVKDVLEGFISQIQSAVTVGEMTQIGEIRPIKAAETEGSMAEILLSDGRSRMNLAAFVTGDMAVVLMVMAPEAQQGEGLKLTEEMAASMQFEPLAEAETTAEVQIDESAVASPTPAPVILGPTEVRPTEAPMTAASGGFGFTVAGEDEPPIPTPTAIPTAASGFGFTAETPVEVMPVVSPVPTVEISDESGVGLRVTSYNSYTDAYGNMYVVGEVFNAGSTPMWNVKLALSLLDGQDDEIGVVDYNPASIDMLPVNGHYPFRFSISKEMQDWQAIDFKVEADPYESGKAYFEPSEALLAADVVGHEATGKYDSFSLTGNVVNKGEVAAGMGKVVVIAYNSDGEVVDVGSASLPMNFVPAGGAVPFDVKLHGLDEAPADYDILVQGREDPYLAERASEVPFLVASSTNYLDRFDRLVIVGEAINAGAVSATYINIAVAVLDANGAVLAMSTSNWNSLEVVPAGGKYPFGFEFGDDTKGWEDVNIQIQAQPYNSETSFLKSHSGLKLEGVTGAMPESDWSGYKLSGQVLNDGDIAANWVKVVAVAYDATGAVVDVNSATPKIDGSLLPGATAPFELEFRGIKKEPVSYQTFVQGREAD